LIACNEEVKLARTLRVCILVRDGQGEIIVVDLVPQTHRGLPSRGCRVFREVRNYAAQKNSAIEKAAGDWILSLMRTRS
jgi:hypothetical protein